MADAKKKALLQAAAEMVRKANMKTAPGDTVLAAITEGEAEHLKADGGSGRTDPNTGVKHFDAGGKREAGGNSGANSNSGSGSNTDGNGRDKDWDSKTGRYVDGPDLNKSPRKALEGADKSWDPNSGKYNEQAGRSGDGDKTLTPDELRAKKYGVSNPNEIQTRTQAAIDAGPDTMSEAESAERKKKIAQDNPLPGAIAKAGLGLVTGNLTGLTSLGERAMAEAKLSRDRIESGLDPSNDPDPRSMRDANSGDKEAKAPVVNESASTKPLEASTKPLEASAKTTQTFDEFVAQARKRKGYMSTILGGKVPAAGTQGKTLLGS